MWEQSQEALTPAARAAKQQRAGVRKLAVLAVQRSVVRLELRELVRRVGEVGRRLRIQRAKERPRRQTPRITACQRPARSC